ncbi:MAG: hypothetical protein EA411_11295 [Saprospirales bacterium]|nr:MAG: hypothetical protein EA411_11295 [Saprospirales bacterium]
MGNGRMKLSGMIALFIQLTAQKNDYGLGFAADLGLNTHDPAYLQILVINPDLGKRYAGCCVSRDAGDI